MSILSSYLEFTENTEPPKQYHRWAFLSCVGACIGRKLWFNHGPGVIYPNLYIMLVGVPGTRKSSSIKLVRKLVAQGDYATFAYNKSTKQKFLLDFTEINDAAKITDANGEIDIDKAFEMPIDPTSSDCFICADEFVDFVGENNGDFITLLTTLWDNLDKYEDRYKNSTPINIKCPTVSILGGLTPITFHQAIPREAGGTGFLSRLILVYGEPTATKITWPKVPSPEETEMFAECFRKLQTLEGQVPLTPAAMRALDIIYTTWDNLPDIRLQYYGSRRLTHLFKLCIIFAALEAIETDKSIPEITEEIVTEANTVLTYTEEYMSMALGEVGKSKSSEAAQKIMEALANASGPMTTSDLWSSVSQDLEKQAQLYEIISNLKAANKIIINSRKIEGDKNEATVAITPRRSVRGVQYVDYHKYIPEYEDRHESLKLINPSAI